MNGRGFLLLKGSFSRLRISLPPSCPSPPPLLHRFFSSNADFSSEDFSRLQTKPTAIPSSEDGASLGDDCITTQELKNRISKYMEGDIDVLPSIFEAILERKLSGKHNDTDDELMEEMRSKMPHTSQQGDGFTLDYNCDTSEEDEDSDSDIDSSS